MLSFQCFILFIKDVQKLLVIHFDSQNESQLELLFYFTIKQYLEYSRKLDSNLSLFTLTHVIHFFDVTNQIYSFYFMKKKYSLNVTL